LKFFHAAQEDLAWCRPWPKFLCIKGVVFMTFWQGLAISILASINEAENKASFKETMGESWAAKTQSFLICLEMLLFAIAHFYAFPVEEWQEGYHRVESTQKFGDTVAIRDFLQDLKLVLNSQQLSINGKAQQEALKKVISEVDAVSSKPKGYQSFDETDGITVPVDEEGTCNDSNAIDKSSTGSPLERGEQQQPNIKESHDITDLRRALAISLFSPDLQNATALLLQASILSKLREEDDTNQKIESKTAADHSFVVNEEVQDEPSESTSLLDSSSSNRSSTKTPNEEILRPSIFTKILPITED
jgi:hypothetical protein